MIGRFKTAVSGPPGRRGVRVLDDAIGADSQESARHARGVSIAASKTPRFASRIGERGGGERGARHVLCRGHRGARPCAKSGSATLT